jgi:signal transduction histidine kinase
VTTTEPAISDLWRYPELAIKMRWSERVDGQEQARLVARGIADRHTPESAVQRLVQDGEFTIAETIVDGIARIGLVDNQTSTRLCEQIEKGRQAAGAQAAVQAQLLRERARRIGMADIDVDAVAADARNRRADAETYLDELDRRVEQVEKDQTSNIKRHLEGMLHDDASALAQAWGDQIRALLDAKEIPAARQMLDEGPGSLSLLPVEEPTAVWPWRTVGLDEILDWFDRSEALAPPGLREYVPDDAGEKLLLAMRKLQEPAGVGHGPLAAAVQELIGSDAVAPHPEPLPGGGHEITLLVPDDFRLPPMSFVGRTRGLRIAIGGEAPADDRDLVWLSTRIREDRRPGSVVLTLADLLSLLQSEKQRSGRPRSTSSRRMGLIRMVCQQLPVLVVIPSDAFVGASRTDLRHQVWWLLHAFGVSPDGVAVDTLLYESGSHPRILVQTLHFLVDYARRRGLVRLEPQAFVDLRASDSYREAVQASLLEELGDAGAAALFTMVFFSSADDLRSALDTIAADAGLKTPLDRLVDVVAVTAALRRTGYLIDDGSGGVALCGCGVTQLLHQGDPHELAKQALRRLAEAEPAGGSKATEERLQEEQFLRWLVEIRLHAESHRARMAEEALDEARGGTSAAAERIRSDRDLREDRQQVEVWRKERVEIDLVEACRTVVSMIEGLADHVDINMHAHGPATIVGSRMALRIALQNIVRNAQQAVQASQAPGERDILVTVSVPEDDRSHALVDVEDNGPGIPPDVWEQLAQGAPPPSALHEGTGEGIVGAVVLLRLFGGSLQVLQTVSPSLGGAHVQLRIPLHGLG